MSFLKVLLTLLVFSTAGWPDRAVDAEVLPILLAQKESADQVGKRLQEKLNGRVLGVKTVQEDGKDYYIFKILTESDGRVRHIKIDAGTGKPAGN